MGVCYPIRVYKNEDITLTIPMDFETEPNEFYLHVYTDNNTYVDIPWSAITVEEGVGTVVIDAGGLDPLNDGVIRYELAYSEGDNDYVENRNTNMVLKTPSNYSGKTADEMWEDGYQSGYTDGQGSQCDCTEAYNSGITEGMREQKSKLTTLNANTNMTYTRTDGYNRVIVNVPQTGYTQQDLDNAYDNGYEAGLNDCSGSTDCSEAYQSGYTEGYDDGLAACSGDCEGIYESGITEGVRQQKAKLIDLTATSNMTFERSDGYKKVVVNVPQTGHTDAEMQDAYDSGYTAGLNDCSGSSDCSAAWNDGYNSGYTDGLSNCGSAYNEQYLTFEIISGGTLSWATGNRGTEYYKPIEYNLNGNYFWYPLNPTNNPLTVHAGDIIRFTGIESGYTVDVSASTNPDVNLVSSHFAGDCIFNVYGNIMSLINTQPRSISHETGFVSATTLTQPYTFRYLFGECLVVSAENLVLPATALTKGCYQDLFHACSYLTEGPKELPATTVPERAYCNMFYSCNGLKETVSVLPAINLGERCYMQMYLGCTSLTTAPELPATNLSVGCYYGMFHGNYNLMRAPELPATTLQNYSYAYMFKSCRSLTKAPELPATILAVGCYEFMFEQAINLTYVKCLATDISATDCTQGWFEGSPSYPMSTKGVFVQDSNTTWSVGIDGVLAGWTIVSA